MKLPALLCAVVVLTACTGLPRVPSTDPRNALSDPQANAGWQAHRQQMRDFTRWSLLGRIGIQTADDGWHGSLNWRQSPAGYELTMTAPLGQGAVQLTGTARGVELRTSKQETHRAIDAETLMRQVLGWTVPVSGLRYWVAGLPVPDVPASQWRFDAQGLLVHLSQQGWDIRLQDYRPVAGRLLPSRVLLEAGDLRVRLRIREWRQG